MDRKLGEARGREERKEEKTAEGGRRGEIVKRKITDEAVRRGQRRETSSTFFTVSKSRKLWQTLAGQQLTYLSLFCSQLLMGCHCAADIC